jgi:Ca2+-binding EF-hand superfamily protein
MSEQQQASQGPPPGVAVCPVPQQGPKLLSPEEGEKIKKKAQETFELYDVDKNGYIDAAEIECAFRSYNQEQGSEIIKEVKALAATLVMYADTNADGKVTFDEFYRAVLKSEGYVVAEPRSMKLH